MKLGRKIAVAALATGLAILPSGAFAGGGGGGPKKDGCQHHCGGGGGGHGHGHNNQEQNQTQGQEQNQNQDQEQNQCFVVIGLLQPATCG